MSISKVFGTYSASQKAEEAVDGLLSSGFQASAISVLHPDTQSSEFAPKERHSLPCRNNGGQNGIRSLDGTLGFRDPGTGPVAGALSSAIAEMGVRADWCDRRVVHGRVLVSVECESPDEVTGAIEGLRGTGAEEVDSTAESTLGTSEPRSETPVGGEQKPGLKHLTLGLCRFPTERFVDRPPIPAVSTLRRARNGDFTTRS